MLKPTEYNVKDSNVENIGSDMDKAARHAAAMTECEWEGAGQVRAQISAWLCGRFERFFEDSLQVYRCCLMV